MDAQESAAAPPRALWLYGAMARLFPTNYRLKIMVMAFVGTHIPLLALASYFAFQASPDWVTLFTTVGITLIATLAGTAVTLYVLNALLRPVLMTSRALRSYRESRTRQPLPTGYLDEVGTLMADAQNTIDHLDGLLHTLEYIDETTGLANRKRFLQLVHDRLGLQQPFALAVLRFDNLTRISDALDRRQANAAARSMAQRLAAQPGLGDMLARVDMLHFACIVGATQGQDAAWVEVAARIRNAITACGHDIVLEGMAIKPALQGGLACWPDDGGDAALLLDRGIAAASRASMATPVMLHSTRARDMALQRFQLEQELRHALERNEFELFYQPVVDVTAGQAIGAEALIRWRHPQRGILLPGDFIGTAESSGLIEPIGLWVLRHACAEVRAWNLAGHGRLRMSINLSARQFMDPELKRHVMEAIANCGISPDQLEIELTETAAMVDHDHTRRVFTSLRDAGIGIAIDDFGTGYASMSYLRQLPFDKLKIDREFVTDVHQSPHNQAICGALIALSKGLGLKVLAEGAETGGEVRYLAQHGCPLFQGYFFSRPLPSAEFRSVLESPLRFALAPA